MKTLKDDSPYIVEGANDKDNDIPEHNFFKRNSQTKEIIYRFRKNKIAIIGFFIIAFLVIIALFPSVFAKYPYDQQNLQDRLTAPSAKYFFGTDDFGRDIYSRVIYGTRISLSIGVISVTFGCIGGVIIGSIAGYYGYVTDNLLMRFIDILLAIPGMMLSMSVVAALGVSRTNLIIALAIGMVGVFARIVRGQVLTIRDQEYIEAAHAIGASSWRIITKHIIPNCMAPIIVQICTNLGGSIISASSMSFIGLGIAPPTPEWGAMLTDARAFMRQAWYVITFPGLAIVITVFGFQMLGDGLRDALDPRLKN